MMYMKFGVLYDYGMSLEPTCTTECNRILVSTGFDGMLVLI